MDARTLKTPSRPPLDMLWLSWMLALSRRGDVVAAQEAMTKLGVSPTQQRFAYQVCPHQSQRAKSGSLWLWKWVALALEM
eukprot:225698-Prorocentrum_minimum.AAC.1